MDTLDIKYKMSKKDLVAKERYHYFNEVLSVRSLLEKLVFCIIVLIYAAVLNMLDIYYLLYPVFILLIYSVFLGFIKFSMIGGNVERQIRTSQYYTKEYHWRISKEGIKRVYEGKEYLTKWEDVFSVKEKKKYFSVLLTEAELLWLPKRVFQSDEALEFAKECLNQIDRKG